MDDVVITGVDAQGRPATLEVQAKRSLAFTASDEVFADVVALACQAAAGPGFYAARHELAVAVARTSTKIEQYAQVVLKWARDYQDAASFFGRLSQDGGAHQQMRDFVSAFRSKMQTAGAAHDDESVWRLLSRFQVLPFDLESPGSLCMAWARERCAAALSATDAARAAELWDSLAQIALEIDATGGDLDSPALRARLEERGYRLAGDRRFHQARDRLAEAANHALAAIKTSVHGVRVDRIDAVEDALRALEHGRYLEILGAGGVGKSAVLKDIADRLLVESRVIVLAPNRVPPGGWPALRAQLGCESTARELLTDIAGDGGGILFIDGIDRFDDPGQRHTVADLLLEASQAPGFRVVATARADFDADARAWIPAQALQTLAEVPPLLIDELSDDQVAQLRQSSPTLASLLRPGHPAEKLVRNLYRLDRLSRAAPSDTSVFSEAKMAKQWWDTGDGAPQASRLDRRRVLRALAIHLLDSSAPMDSGALRAEAITGLIDDGSLRQVTLDRTQPTHDVLGDWAIGCLLFDEPDRVATLPLSSPAPMRLARGLEVAARLHAELGADTQGWLTLLEHVSVAGAHGSWRRAVLLAPVRSERCTDALDRCLPNIASERDASLLLEIVRTSIAIDSQAAAPFWAATGFDASRFTDDFALPRGPTWLNLIKWSLANIARLPQLTLPQWVDLYGRWCNAYLGQDALSPVLVKQLYSWLIAAEASSRPHSYRSSGTADEAPRLSLSESERSDLRRTFLAWCLLCPEEAESYLSALARQQYRDEAFRELLSFVGTAPNAAPQTLADLFLQVLPEGGEDRSYRDLSPRWDLEYLPASPARPPFLALLQTNKEQGLRLIRGLIDDAVTRRSRGRAPGDDQIEVPFPGGTRSFSWEQSYMMSRSDNSYIVVSALMALEAWAHLRIEAGDQVQDVIEDVLGPEGSPAAYLLVAIDLLLSHWPQSQESIWPFAASPQLLVHDHLRLAHEPLGHLRQAWVHPEPSSSVRLADLQRRLSRRVSLVTVLGNLALYGPESVREATRTALQAAAVRLGAPDDDDGLNDPSVMAAHALNRLDPVNYRGLGNPPGTEGFEYVAPSDEASRFTRLQQRSAPRYAQTVLVSQLTHAVTEQVCPTPILEQGVAWATRPANADEEPTDDIEKEMVERARLIVAALVLRDGSPEMRAAHGSWAAARLADAADSDTDEDRTRQLPYNPAGIAAIGLLAGYRNAPGIGDLPRLLRLAAQPSTGIVEVVRLELRADRPLSDDLKRSLVRLALTASIYAVRQREDLDGVTDFLAHHNAQEAARKRADQERRQVAVDAELARHAGQSPEPSWPDFPPPNEPRLRRRIRIGAAVIEPVEPALRMLALNDSKAAEVVELAVELWRVSNPELLGSLVRHAWQWTAAANGVGTGEDYEPGERALKWNHAYFPAALTAGVALGQEHIQTYLVEPMAQLPEERFLMAVESTLQALDQLWLGDDAITDQAAIALRETIVQRIQTTRHWRQLLGEPSTGIASDAARAVAAMFMNNYLIGGRLNCYVLPPGMSRVDRCLPLLVNAAEQAGGSTFVALAILSLLEVTPHPSRLHALSRIVTAWWTKHGANAGFWVTYGIAKRVCDWIDNGVLNADASRNVLESEELTSIVDVMLKCGGPMARSLEERVNVKCAIQPPEEPDP